MATNSTALLSDLVERLRKRGDTLPLPGTSAVHGLPGVKDDFFGQDQEDGPNEKNDRAPMIEYALFRMDQQARYCQ